MNINQLKTFLGNNPQHLGNENSLQNKLRDVGLEQAVRGQSNLQKLQSDTFSSSSSLGLKIYSNSMGNSIELNRQKLNFSVPDKDVSDESLFNFEEVTKNVLSFVTNAITNAQKNGANEEELNSLFDQALEGVLKGVELAEQDLAGFMNEELADGISQSKSFIEQGIERLRDRVFEVDSESSSVDVSAASVTTNISNERSHQGELYIRTIDGDQVRLIFNELEQLDVSQKQLLQNIPPESETVTPEVLQPITDVVDSQVEEGSGENTNSVPETSTSVDVPEESAVVQQNAVYYQESSLSFAVKGELDEEELEAIASLVADTYDLADEFFNGDIEGAFNQALELGFDEQELSGFALQLTKVENTQVIKAYENVSRYDNDSIDVEPTKAATPVADYLDKLLNVLDGSRVNLEGGSSYENLVNGLINQLGSEVATPDLITAINRFNEFNQRLVDNLPVGYQPEPLG